MLQTLKNAWRTKELRNKILFTLLILALYRLGTVIPVPFIDAHNLGQNISGTILEYLDILSGGSLSQATLFALGVSPYINASIIIQLLAVVFPKLGEMAKNDKAKMNFITRILTVALAIVTGLGYYFLMVRYGLLNSSATAEGMKWLYAIVIIACYSAGASLVMWLAERINEHGIGNGVSIILFANIISALPSLLIELVSLVVSTYKYGEGTWYFALVSTAFAVLLLAFYVAMIVFVIWVTGSERRIPVQYAKRVVGRKMYGGQSTNLPIKLNMTGVMPIIFASSIVSLIPTILSLCGVTGSGTGFWDGLYKALAQDGVIYPITFFLLIVGFTYFYTQITFDPIEVANNLNKQGGIIPGYRQGRPTADHIRKILNKITLAGSLFLAIVALIPLLAGPHGVNPLITWLYSGNFISWGWNAESAYNFTAAYYSSMISSLTSKLTFGGTSLLIVVGVAIETFRELEAQLTMRSYKGFLN